MNRSLPTRVVLLATTWLLAGCSVAGPPSKPPGYLEASPSSSLAPSLGPTGGPTLPPSEPPPSPSGPTGGGLMLVFQLDGDSLETATTQSVYTIDVGTGERRDLGTVAVSEQTCCPMDAVWSSDRTRGFLFSAGYVGAVDAASGAIELATLGVERFKLLPSHRGDRLAWLDEFSGAWESLVLADITGETVGTLELPETAWQTEFAWAPDDSAFAIATVLTIPGLEHDLSHVGLAPGPGSLTAGVDLACCTPDHGVTANHLQVVAVDGGQIVDLLSDEQLVRRDLQEPNPTLPPDLWTNGPLEPNRDITLPTWAPDGRSIAYVQSACEVSFDRRGRGHCTYEIRAIDVDGSSSRRVLDVGAPVWSLAWSPRGDRLAYTVQARDATELFAVEAGGGDPVSLGSAEGNVHWSPDGSWISFFRVNPERTDGNRVDLVAKPLDGGDEVIVAERAAGGW